MANNESAQKTGHIVDVTIVDVEKRKNDGPKYYAYVLQVKWANPSNMFIIYRRYAQFFDLHCRLLDLFDETPTESKANAQPRQIPGLPGKIILGRSQVRQIALERKQELNEYCQALIALPERISRCSLILEFFHPTASDVQKPVESVLQEKKQVDTNSLVISGPNKLATYRCLADFKAIEKIELSLKRNDIVQVLQKHPNGWWFVQLNDQTGFVPGTYLEPSDLKRGAREVKVIEKSLNETYIVTQTYTGTGKDELSLQQGSFVTVIEKTLTGWWKVKFNNLQGQFPAIYLTSCDGRHTPGNALDDAPQNSSKKKQPVTQHDSDDDVEDDYNLDASKVKQFELYYAHKDFHDTTGDCLSFKRGDVIEIIDKRTNGWWLGRKAKGGEPIVSRVPANCLQKEPISVATTKNVMQPSSTSKARPKTPEQVQKSSSSLPTKDKSFTLGRQVENSSAIKKPQPNVVPSTTTALFRPVNDKPVSTSTIQKPHPIVTPSPFRPTANNSVSSSKPSSVSIPSAFRSTNTKQDTSTSTSNNSSHPVSSAFRPVNSKSEVSAFANKSNVNMNRPVNVKEDTTQKSVKNLTSKFNQK